jgi:hypothetical protein
VINDFEFDVWEHHALEACKFHNAGDDLVNEITMLFESRRSEVLYYQNNRRTAVPGSFRLSAE